MTEPVARRPQFSPLYGIAEDDDGLLPWSWAEERLAAARNYWVSTTSADGAPAAIPVWAIWIDGGVVFGTSPRSQKGRNLARDPRVVIHLESGDETVILHGSVEPVPPELSDAATKAYNAKYAIEQEVGEGWLMLRPRRALAWREQDYPQSATRFDFP